MNGTTITSGCLSLGLKKFFWILSFLKKVLKNPELCKPLFCNYLMLDIIPQPLLLFTAGSRGPN